MDEEAVEDEREVVDESRYFTLGLVAEGWGVWDRRGPDEPVALFPPNDDGLELAQDYFARVNRRERIKLGPWLPILRWVALVAGAAWVVSSAVVGIRLTLVADPFQSDAAFEAIRWAQAVDGIAYPVFLVSFGAYVMLWLRSRSE